MNIKTYIVTAIAALTLVACAKNEDTEIVPADESEAAHVQLNDDGSIASPTPTESSETTK